MPDDPLTERWAALREDILTFGMVKAGAVAGIAPVSEVDRYLDKSLDAARELALAVLDEATTERDPYYYALKARLEGL